MPARLRLAKNFWLPAETVTGTLAVIAKRGAGKTYSASVLVEEMIAAGLPTCVIDPLGVWWGLRADADGTGPGLPVTILGGEHADLPLPLESGSAVADLVAGERLPLVVDLSEWSRFRQRRWVCEFMEQLFLVNRDPLHLVVDEADIFAPQRVGKTTLRLLDAYSDVQRRGRTRGLGTTAISQRPAVLHKDILSQVELLIALQTSEPRDINAIDNWVRVHDAEGQAAEVKATLPALPVGTAWVWSPGWLNILQKIHVRARHTFDSSATPELGQHPITPRQFATVSTMDLARVQQWLESATPTAHASDPHHHTALLQELDQLRRQLAVERSRPPVEVPVLTAEAAQPLHDAITRLETTAANLRTALQAAQPNPRTTPHNTEPTTHAPHHHRSTPPNSRPQAAKPDPPPSTPTDTTAAPLKSGERRMLAVLARHYPLRLTRAQLATLASLTSTGGTYSHYLSALHTNDLITIMAGSHLVELTDHGRALTGVTTTTPMTSPELREMWLSVLRAGARTMMKVLLDRWPAPTGRAELALAAGLEPTGGTYSSYLSILRGNGLIEIHDKQVTAVAAAFGLQPTDRRG